MPSRAVGVELLKAWLCIGVKSFDIQIRLPSGEGGLCVVACPEMRRR